MPTWRKLELLAMLIPMATLIDTMLCAVTRKRVCNPCMQYIGALHTRLYTVYRIKSRVVNRLSKHFNH